MINQSINIELVNIAGDISLPKIQSVMDEVPSIMSCSCESCDGSCNTCYQ